MWFRPQKRTIASRGIWIPRGSLAAAACSADRPDSSDRWSGHVDDFAGPDALNCVHERREQRSVIFHPVLWDMDDYDAEGQLLEIVLVLKALVDGNQNVALALGLGNELGVGECAPLGLRDGQNFMLGKGLPDARIDALV